jgi:hypothetical protein
MDCEDVILSMYSFLGLDGGVLWGGWMKILGVLVLCL